MQKSCRRNVPPISFSFRPNTDAPDPVSLSSDLLYLAGTALNWVCTPNVTSNVMRRSASNSFPATAFRSTRHGRSGTTFALVPACHHLPPRVADQMVGVAAASIGCGQPGPLHPLRDPAFQNGTTRDTSLGRGARQIARDGIIRRIRGVDPRLVSP